MTAIVYYPRLEDRIVDPLYTYSAGMKPRLGFSVCSFLRSEVLFIDEMLGVGDEEFRRESMASLRSRVISEQTVVMVSHQMPQIAQVCDRILWLEQGLVRALGPTRDVLLEYKADLR